VFSAIAAAMVVLALGAVSWGRARSAPAPARGLPVAAASRGGPVSAVPEAPPASSPEPAEPHADAPPTEPPPRASPHRHAAHPVGARAAAAPNLDRELDAALEARQVSRADVAKIAPVAMLAFTDATARGDVARARSAALTLIDAAREAALSPEALGRRLDRFGERLVRSRGAPADELRAIETSYFELRAGFPPPLPKATAFAQRLSALEARLGALGGR
jgi:hypothetical protein